MAALVPSQRNGPTPAPPGRRQHLAAAGAGPHPQPGQQPPGVVALQGRREAADPVLQWGRGPSCPGGWGRAASAAPRPGSPSRRRCWWWARGHRSPAGPRPGRAGRRAMLGRASSRPGPARRGRVPARGSTWPLARTSGTTPMVSTRLAMASRAASRGSPGGPAAPATGRRRPWSPGRPAGGRRRTSRPRRSRSSRTRRPARRSWGTAPGTRGRPRPAPAVGRSPSAPLQARPALHRQHVQAVVGAERHRPRRHLEVPSSTSGVQRAALVLEGDQPGGRLGRLARVAHQPQERQPVALGDQRAAVHQRLAHVGPELQQGDPGVGIVAVGLLRVVHRDAGQRLVEQLAVAARVDRWRLKTAMAGYPSTPAATPTRACSPVATSV